MLGTGSAFAKTFYNNNALVYANGYTLLVDCGITAPAALHSLGKSPDEIHALLVTHIHADHVGGLEEIAFRMKFQYQRKPLLYVPEVLAVPLWENALKGGLSQDEGHTLEDYFDVRLMEEGHEYELAPGLCVEIIETPHIPNKASFSLYLNRHLFYSADMRFNPELLHSLVDQRGCDTILHDCQFINPGAVHACLDDLVTLPEFIQQRLWLMHYADNQPEYIGKTGQMRFIEQQRLYDDTELSKLNVEFNEA
ncbi:ribonuclease Z [Paenibacillus sp. MAHUQ-46]|uniref:Ribonuclease Z n=2 Tax=Paenibacillus TaxID=44249 RepID=A0A934J1U0_9BACL|nr:ribonuclease Z [Paenibacillus roseus]